MSAAAQRNGIAVGGGAAHPIDALRAHHWQEQLSASGVPAAPPAPRFPSTLKTARHVAVVERRLQEPPPPGLQRFAQFQECTTEEIARMIELRERSLGEAHSSVPPLYDVLGDMMQFEGDATQAERFYVIALSRLEQRSALMQAQQQQRQQQHPTTGADSQWLRDATAWSQEVAALQAKLGVMWMQSGRHDAAAAAFMKAAQLASPGAVAARVAGGSGDGARAAGAVALSGLHNNTASASASGGGAHVRRSESPSALHLRSLLAGVNKDKAVIASALSERLLGGAAGRAPASSAFSAVAATGATQRRPSSSVAAGHGDDEDMMGVDACVAGAHEGADYSDDDLHLDHRPHSHHAPLTAAAANPQHQNLHASSAAPMTFATTSPAPLHDASSLKRLVDSVAAGDTKAEQSRGRMRAQIAQLHGGSLSPARRKTNETVRKTKDLQDIISRIRSRADLMPQQ